MDHPEHNQPSQNAVALLAKAWMHSPDGFRILDGNGIMLEVNNAFCGMVHKDQSDLIGRSFSTVYAERGRKEMEEQRLMHFMRQTVPEHSEMEYELWNGDRKWFNIDHVFSSEPHQVAAVVSIFKDVTQRKKMEEAARIAAERYQFIFDTIEDVYFETTLDGIITTLSPSIKKYSGYTCAGLIGKSIMPYYEETELRANFLAELNRSGAVTDFEASFRKADGTCIPHAVNAQVIFSDNGQPLKICGFIRDIADKKRNEKTIHEQAVLWESLAKNLPFDLWVRNNDGRIIFQNQMSIEHGGIQLGEVLDEHNGPEGHSACCIENNRRALSGEVAVAELRSQRGDTVTQYRQIIAPLRDGASISGTVGINIDVTEQRNLELQLLQAQKIEGLGTLAGGIAHDFNNLLSMILGSAELLRAHANGDEKILKHIGRIIESSERGASISRQLLLFSRPDQVKLEPLSISHIVLQVQEMLRHFLPKDISVSTTIDIENGMIMGESGHIHQALLNLAINARDAMPNGGLLNIRATSMSGTELSRQYSGAEAPEYVVIKVSDSGIGMSKETLAKIFNPFFTTKGPGKGTGLGLSIVHGIVKSHHGFLRVESEVGNGTSFTICIPSIDQTAQPLPAPMEYHTAQKETVLIVDDEDLIREVLYDTLEEAGYTVLAAEDGAEGLRMYNQFMDTIALVITDIGMPKMSGTVFIKKLKEINPGVKVIVSSGFMDLATKEQMAKLGVAEILSKPYKFATIHAVVHKVLQA